jgi:uncharacterized repeat protein (TIGR03803 family)
MRPTELCSGAKRFFITLLVTSVAATSANATHETILHNFVAFPRGANPQANLVADSAGNLYGTTLNGGRYGFGTVFELTPDKNGKWTQTVLHSFTGGSDGAHPVAGLIFDDTGSLYGTTINGGIVTQSCPYGNGCGVVFELTPGPHGTWTEMVLYSFKPSNDGESPSASLIFNSAGHLFGTTQFAGNFKAGTVFELTRGSNGVWTETILYVFSGGADGANPMASLILDSTGNLYGTTQYGGNLNCDLNGVGCGTVFKLTPHNNRTWSETVLYTFNSVGDAYPLSSLVFDSAGNLYGTTGGQGYVCGGGCGTVFRLAPHSNGVWTETIIHTFAGGSDGAGPAAGLVLDGAGNLYGTTQYGGSWASCSANCGTVFELRPSKGSWTETVIHRFGRPVHGQDDGNYPAASLFLSPAGKLFGTAQEGGDESCHPAYGFHEFQGCGTVFELSPVSGGKWTPSVPYVFSKSLLGVGPASGLISDSAGNLYGVTASGGASNYGVAFELMTQPSGRWKEAVLHSFLGNRDGSHPGSSLISDSAGNLYGITANGGRKQCNDYQSCGGTVFELSPTGHGWKETVLYRFGNNNGAAISGLVMDSLGNLYGTTQEGGNTNCGPYGCGTVYKLSPVGGGKWKKDLLYMFQGGSDGAGPYSTLTFDDKGALYGTTYVGGASGNGTVFKLAPGSDGKWKESVLYSFQGGSGDGSHPVAGVIFDSNGNLYGTTFYGGTNYCHNQCGVVFELSPSGGGGWKETVLLAFRGTDGSNPKGVLTLDAAGNLYGAAPYNGPFFSFPGGTVFELSPGSKGWTEHVLHRFGKGFDGAGPNGALIFDSAGNIYGTTYSGGADIVPSDLGGTVFELSPRADKEWVEDIAAPSLPIDSRVEVSRKRAER